MITIALDPSVQSNLKFVCDTIRGTPLLMTLLILMFADVFAGILVACDRRTLNSTISFRGMTRKVFTLLLVGVATTLEPFAQGLPLAKLVAMFYIVTEAISITENAAALGVPLPRTLVEMLQKLKEDQQKRMKQKLPHDSPVVHIELPPKPDKTQITVESKPTDDKK